MPVTPPPPPVLATPSCAEIAGGKREASWRLVVARRTPRLIASRAIVLSDPALTGQLASTPEFWQAVQALGDRYYSPPTEMAGMPTPLPPR